jgi:hypothetical protein
MSRMVVYLDTSRKRIGSQSKNNNRTQKEKHIWKTQNAMDGPVIAVSGLVIMIQVENTKEMNLIHLKPCEEWRFGVIFQLMISKPTIEVKKNSVHMCFASFRIFRMPSLFE